MSKTYLLGIDLGTSSLKVVAYTESMKQLTCIRRPYVSSPQDKVTAEHWWKAFLSSLAELKDHINLSQVACVSFSGYNAFVGVDQQLLPSTPVLLYYHTAPCVYMQKIFQKEDQDYVFSRSCTNMFGSGIMAPGIRWLKDCQPEAYQKTSCFLYSNGFLASRLTGHCVIDASRASLSALHDPRGAALCWDTELCNFFEIEPNRLPHILNPWESAGKITLQASSLCGLPAGIPVVIGSMDSLCAALGNGIFSNAWMLDIGGSAGGLACVSSSPHAHPRLYLSRYALPGLWCNNAPLMSSARLFDWFTEKLAPGWTMEDYIQAVNSAPRFSRGLSFLPYIGGARYPYWSMDTEGHFLHFSPDCTIQDMARAVVEGLGCAYRNILDDLNSMGLPVPERIVAAGGDTKFHTWIQSKANYLRIPYYLSDTSEVSAKGAALLAAYHIGSVPDPISYLKATSTASSVITPEDPSELFEAHYQRFRKDCALLYGNIN